MANSVINESLSAENYVLWTGHAGNGTVVTSTEIANLLPTKMAAVATAATIVSEHLLYENRRRFVFPGIVMVLGVIGNFLALVILARKKANKNSKYTLMLRCLASNNLVGLLGMLITLLLKINLPDEVFQEFVKWNCAAKVVWRFFGLSSGCIAAVMALERWMALARPFIYHKHITYELVRKSINSLVLVAVIITFLPFFGFGAYMTEDPKTHLLTCIRYRDADGTTNKIYAIIFMIFGTLLCIVIVACNLFVTRVLCFIGRSRTTKRHMRYDLVNVEKHPRSIDAESSSGSTLYQTQFSTVSNGSIAPPPRQIHHSNSVTMTAGTSPDEIKFAKLMAYLSISFVICWMPQMIAIPMAILPNRVPKEHPFFLIADVLMALHFTLDPYIYVLSRTKHSYILGCIKRCRWTGLRRSQSDQSRLRTTATEQHSLDGCVL